MSFFNPSYNMYSNYFSNNNSNYFNNNYTGSYYNPNYYNNDYINKSPFNNYIEQDTNKMSDYEAIINTRIFRGKIGSPTIVDYAQIIDKAQKYSSYQYGFGYSDNIGNSTDQLFGTTTNFFKNYSPSFSDNIGGWYTQLGQNLSNDYSGLQSFSNFLNKVMSFM